MKWIEILRLQTLFISDLATLTLLETSPTAVLWFTNTHNSFNQRRFTSFINNYLKAVSSRQLPLCCVVCNTKIQRVKNNKGTRHYSDNPEYKVPPGRSVNLRHPSAVKIFLEIVSNGLVTQNNKSSPPPSSRRSLPPSVSGYSLSKSISNYSIKSGKFLQWNVRHLITNQSPAGSSSSQVSGRSVRSSPSLQSISSIKSAGSNSSWFSVNSLSSFQCANLDKSHKQKLRVGKS